MDSLKNLLLAGLGAASYSQEKLRNLINEAIDRGELTREQGESILEDWVSKGKEEREQLSSRFSEEARKMIEKAGLVGRDEFDALVARVQALEEQSR